MTSGNVTTDGVSLVVGAELPPFAIAAVDPQSMKLWAGFLRDPNPIHLDPRAVQAKGLGDRVINQGPANLAYLITMLQRAFPGSNLAALDVRYIGSVFGGDAVEAGGRISEVAEGQTGPRVTCEVWLRANARDIVITGTSVLSLPCLGDS
jgi:3-hydroxybutyryl-CoA dehydratase